MSDLMHSRLRDDRTTQLGHVHVVCVCVVCVCRCLRCSSVRAYQCACCVPRARICAKNVGLVCVFVSVYYIYIYIYLYVYRVYVCVSICMCVCVCVCVCVQVTETDCGAVKKKRLVAGL